MPRSPVDSGGRGAPRGDSPHPRERRRATRIACEQWIAASFEDQPGEPILLRCCDISTTGLAFVSSRPLPPGLRGAVRIARRNGRSGVVGVEVQARLDGIIAEDVASPPRVMIDSISPTSISMVLA